MKTPYVPIFILNEINRQPKAFLKKVLGNRTPPVHKVLTQIEAEIKRGTIKPIEPIQLMMNILSLCIFPFVACPMIQLITGMDNKQFNEMMEKRKKEVPQIITQSIRK
jgi:hypothetical protein